MDKQHTITREASISGIGLHTANKVNLTLKPAESGAGVNFIRIDLPGQPMVKACIENVFTQRLGSLRRSSLKKDNVEIHTIEHLMAALAGLGIDNINIELDNDEVCGLDGSSLNFVEILEKAGIKEQEKQRRYFVLREPITVEEGDSSIIALPCNDFRISYTLNYNHSALKTQFKAMAIGTENFKSELASARTFCLEEEANKLREVGLGRGADYKNTLVVGKAGVINNSLRFEDEFLRHKMLDLIGDLYLLGQPLKAHIIALKSGHALNLKLVEKMFEQNKKNNLGGITGGQASVEKEVLDINDIMGILPHREPFLFVDRIVALEKGKRAVGIKNVSINDYFFKGHFPGKPVMPGVIIIEAMAQVGGIMMLSSEENRGKLAYFMTMDNVKFRKVVVPGDQLVFEVTAGKIKSRTGTVHGQALVDGKIVAEADLMFTLADR